MFETIISNQQNIGDYKPLSQNLENIRKLNVFA